ncbi:MAG: SAM-dependent methyltransferase [Alphaproteobacteria bacterium]|nr:SAM-dependent methyltransferase [Alphaproteobacteria bacterium]
MQADVTHFDQFYHNRLGGWVRAEIQRLICSSAPENPQDLIVGLGYSQPFLEKYRAKAPQRLALMPAQLGALQHNPIPQALCIPTLLPLRDSSVRGLLMVHLLELADNPKLILREVWRVLQDDGELLLIVPHRRGLWARSTEQPFGLGMSYSRNQLRQLLETNGYEIHQISLGLSFPPLQHARLQRLIPFLRSLGKALRFPAGVLVVRAKKAQLNPSAVGKTYTIPGRAKLIMNQGLSRADSSLNHDTPSALNPQPVNTR